MFSGFSVWDDEGYLLATVKAVVDHHVLYDQIYTLYGPFYYLVEWLFYAVTGLAPSHDCVRLIGWMLWPTCTVLLTWPVYRITRSVVLGAFTLIVVMRLLVFFAWDPGHPEEICLALLAGVILGLTGISSTVSAGRMVALGVLAASICQTKINLGVYVCLALLLALLAALRGNKWRNVLLAATAATSLVLVTGIMTPLFHFSWVREYWVLFIASFCTVLPAAFIAKSEVVIGARSWVTLVSAFALAYAAAILPFLARGTTISAFLYGTIFQHKDFSQHWANASALGAGTILCSACSLCLFLLWLIKPGNQTLLAALQLFKAVLALPAAYLLLLYRMDWPVGVKIMTFAAPFTWLLLLLPTVENGASTRFPRIALAFISVFVNLYAFPVAGSQNLFAIVPLALVIAIFLHDGLVSLALRTARLPQFWPKVLAAAAGFVLTAYGYLHDLRAERYRYTGTPSLALPGAVRVHDYPKRVKTFQWLTHKIDARCSSFFSMPGFFSLYFWTQEDSPTLKMINNPGFLDNPRQHLILRDLTTKDTPCIVYSPDLMAFFHASDFLQSSPIGQYLKSNFVTADQRDGYQFMVRKGTALAKR